MQTKQSIASYPAHHHITKKGYVRFRVPKDSQAHDAGKMRMGHDWIWEQHNGPIPEGMHIHHKDEKKQHNEIDNLELMDTVTHKRIHGGCNLVDGVWWKPCPICHETKPVDVDHWYKYKSGMPEGKWWPMPICKVCHVKEAVISKRIRRERKKALGIPWRQRD